MKIAIPTAQGKLCAHFGHCETFTMVEVEDGAVLGMEQLDPPPHEPGVLPRWLAEQGANVIIAGGMGQRAQILFTQQGIEVVVGAAPDAPEKLVENWLKGSLETGQNACDH